MPRIPDFKSAEEEAEFWETHDTMDYMDELEPVEIEIDPDLRNRIQARARNKKAVTLRLAVEQIEAAKAIANEKGLPYQTMIRMWIQEAIRRERRVAR